MLTKTTETGIQALMYLALRQADAPVSPRTIAEQLGLSSTYLAKITAQLVKAGLLRAQRGVKGGVQLSRPPRDIRLLDIVEALQGRIIGRYCVDAPQGTTVCGFHDAMLEIHEATIRIFSRWTLADLASRAVGRRDSRANPHCLMQCLRSAAPRPT
jgi:Rrf2 family protein